MKVSELMDILRQYDDDMEVEIAYSDGGGFYLGSREPEPEVETAVNNWTNEPYPLLLL